MVPLLDESRVVVHHFPVHLLVIIDVVVKDRNEDVLELSVIRGLLSPLQLHLFPCPSIAVDDEVVAVVLSTAKPVVTSPFSLALNVEVALRNSFLVVFLVDVTARLLVNDFEFPNLIVCALTVPHTLSLLALPAAFAVEELLTDTLSVDDDFVDVTGALFEQVSEFPLGSAVRFSEAEAHDVALPVSLTVVVTFTAMGARLVQKLVDQTRRLDFDTQGG